MSRGSSTLTKGLDVLKLMGQYPDGAPAAVFARESGLPFSTVYRLLNTLADTGFAQYDPRTKEYRLGLTVFELSQTIASARGYDGTVVPVLRQLSEATNESCLFAVQDGTESVTVHTVDGPEFRQTTDPGDRLPLHISSMGKAILSALPEAEARQIMAEAPLVARTEHTVTDPQALWEQLVEGRAVGYLYQNQEVDLGMNALAAPVTTPSGQVLGAVAIAAPIFRADRDQLVQHHEALVHATRQLAATLPAGR